MQKYKSNITSTSGAAIRGVPVLVLTEAGENAAIFLDRAGAVPAPNPLTTGANGTFYFYAVNGRYSLRTTVDGVTITDDDVVLMMDPEEITVAGPIAEAVAAAQAAAIAAEFAVEDSGIPDLVAAAQNAVVDANNAVSLSATSANNAAISKTGADSARDAAVIAKDSAEAALDSFDDRYLGAKAVAPTTDNDGGALLTGALYWDTALPGMRSWNGTEWVTLPAATKASVGLANVDNTSDAAKMVASAGKLTTARTINGVSFDGSANISIDAAAVPNTPAGSISATTVQAAINELDSEKVAKTDVIAIANGGTGATTANAAADAIGAFRRGTLLGTVGQSAGVPTGAVIERGSNANGAYVRYADGTQICTLTAFADVATAGATYNNLRTFPAAFSVAPTVSPAINAISATYVFYGQVGANDISTTSATIARHYDTAQTYTIGCVAVGRWF